MHKETRIRLCSSMNEAKTFTLETLGCKVNQYESMAVKSQLIEAGYLEMEEDRLADIVIINTCSVTHVADKKSRQTIRRKIKENEDAIVLVMGCYAQVNAEEIQKIEGVDIVIGTEGKSRIVEILDSYFRDCSLPRFESFHDSSKLSIYEEIKTEYHPEKTRAFIKVQDGCNLFCSYCIIPYARGRIRSRKLDDVMEELFFLEGAGYKEVVLTGIHLSSYGLDWTDKDQKEYGIRLIDLIEMIGREHPKIRIRLGSLEPGIVTRGFAQRISKVPGICDHFHLSLQSGSDAVLRQMNRRYDAKRYLQAVEYLREYFDKPGFSTDVIVGFPGETDEHFQESYDFCERIGFAKLHVFPYSPREGTPAARMPSQLSKGIKSERVARLIALAEKMESEYLQTLLGTEQEVLLEVEEGGIVSGLARNGARIYLETGSEGTLHRNSLLRCTVSAFEDHKLKGVYNELSIL